MLIRWLGALGLLQWIPVGFVRKEYNCSSSLSLEGSHSPLCSPPSALLVHLQFPWGLSAHPAQFLSNGAVIYQCIPHFPSKRVWGLNLITSSLYSVNLVSGFLEDKGHVLTEFRFKHVSGVVSMALPPAMKSSFSASAMRALDPENQSKCIFCAILNYRRHGSLFVRILWSLNIHCVHILSVK